MRQRCQLGMISESKHLKKNDYPLITNKQHGIRENSMTDNKQTMAALLIIIINIFIALI